MEYQVSLLSAYTESIAPARFGLTTITLSKANGRHSVSGSKLIRSDHGRFKRWTTFSSQWGESRRRSAHGRSRRQWWRRTSLGDEGRMCECFVVWSSITLAGVFSSCSELRECYFDNWKTLDRWLLFEKCKNRDLEVLLKKLLSNGDEFIYFTLVCK